MQNFKGSDDATAAYVQPSSVLDALGRDTPLPDASPDAPGHRSGAANE
ncbi:hypothetical protein [Streptomyces sp. CA2R101]